MPLEWSNSGPLALRVRFASAVDDAAFRIGRALVGVLKARLDGMNVEVVPAFASLLILPENAAVKSRATEVLSALPWPLPSGGEDIRGRQIELEVTYDGEDLPRVAAHAGVSEASVIALHSAPEYRVHCLGFSPGFPYLGGLNPVLRTPRLSSPRARVAAGSVAIGGEQTGVYSVAGPGGWNLIGWTPEPIFRPWAEALTDIFLMHPGDCVQFRAGRRRSGQATSSESPPPQAVAGAMPSLRLLSAGMGVTVQDPGRPGYRRFGVPPGGVMDPYAAAWANRLLENPEHAPVLELCLQGQRLEVLESGWLAVTGSSSGPAGKSGGWSAFRVRAGEVLEFPPGPAGIWSYLGLPGGVAAPRFLGSASQHPQAGIGAWIRPGDVIGRESGSRFCPPSPTAVRRVSWTERPRPTADGVVRAWPGPQWDQFSDEDRERLFSAEWRISARSNRVGFRLEGPLLSSGTGEMISEAVLAGCVQVPPSGQPLITMPDGPTLGGYPQLAIVDPEDLPLASQVRPGHVLRFRLAKEGG